MLLNLMPGAWDHQYAWLEHAKWAGGTFIDLVAPVFLFCIGVALALSLQRRLSSGASRAALVRHVIVRALVLVLIGVFLNAYPKFDFAHLRIPGVLQRIGITYGLVACFAIATSRSDGNINRRAVWWAIATILFSYFALLQWVPVPGYGAPRFDPVGSWPAVIDRAVITPVHMFPWWPVDGKVVFDPEGILSTWPACTNILFGLVVGAWYLAGAKRSVIGPAAAGALLMIAAIALHPVCPVIKNLWTPTFALFTCGFGLAALGLLTALEASPAVTGVLYPAKIFGSNALLAYMLCFLLSPLLDVSMLRHRHLSFRQATFQFFSHAASPNLASLLAGFVFSGILFVALVVCYRRRWLLKL